MQHVHVGIYTSINYGIYTSISYPRQFLQQ